MTTDTHAESTTLPVEAAALQVDNRSYKLSRDGRRQAIILLLGVVSIWVFGLWSLVVILDGGISGIEWVSALLMAGILLVAPLVAWALLEEINSRIIVGPDGIRYTTLGGIDLTYNWEQVAGFGKLKKQGKVARFFLGPEDERTDDLETVEEDEDAHGTKLLHLRGGSSRIVNPIVNFLHNQISDQAIPLHGGLEERADLLARVNARLQ